MATPTRSLRTVAFTIGAVAVAVLVAPALSGAAGEARATRSVTVGDIFFRPTSLSVRRGTRVRWVWRGQLGHNVTVVRGPTRFRSRTQTSGSFSRVLRRRGSYRLICTIHGAALQSMRIRVR
jgi:plastocyanin